MVTTGRSDLRRRQFLRMVAMITATGSLGQISLAASALASGEKTTLADRLLQALPDPDGARVIGHAFLDGTGDRPVLDHVVAGLAHNLDLSVERLSETSALDLRARLKTRTSDEFRLGRTTKVRGWLLGESEAWLCGLAALRAA
jgi:hypothetical protein